MHMTYYATGKTTIITGSQSVRRRKTIVCLHGPICKKANLRSLQEMVSKLILCPAQTFKKITQLNSTKNLQEYSERLLWCFFSLSRINTERE